MDFKTRSNRVPNLKQGISEATRADLYNGRTAFGFPMGCQTSASPDFWELTYVVRIKKAYDLDSINNMMEYARYVMKWEANVVE